MCVRFIHWVLSILIAIVLHVLAVYLFVHRDRSSIDLSASALIVDFSDPPQSISFNLPVPEGALQTVSVAAQASREKPVPTPQPVKNTPKIKAHKPVKSKPNIVVKKQRKNRSTPKPKVKLSKQIEKKNIKKVRSTNPRQEQNQTLNSRATPATSAPKTGSDKQVAANFNSAGLAKKQLITWRGVVKAHIAKHLRYPSQALRKRWKGKVVVLVEVDARGNVQQVTLRRSCGKKVLDNAALDSVRRASPLPEPPKRLMNKAVLRFITPVYFDGGKVFN